MTQPLVVILSTLAIHAALSDRAPAMVCAALEAEGFAEISGGAPKWTDDGMGTFGCAAQVQVGAPDRTRFLSSAVQFMAESRDRSVVQKVSLSASMFNPRTKPLALKRLRIVAETLFRAMALQVPGTVFAAIEKARVASATMPYGAVRFARVEGVNIEQWTLTVTLDSPGVKRPAAAH